MSTVNRRAAVYLPKNLDDLLKAFAADRNLKGDSPALIAILSEYFGVSRQVAHEVNYLSSFVTLESFESLSSQVVALADKVEVILRGLELPSDDSHGKSLSEPSDELPHETQLSEIESGSISADDQAEAETPLVKEQQIGIKQRPMLPAVELCKRLGVGRSTVSTRKEDSAEKFAEWTRSKDPAGIAWVFISESNLFQPTGELADDVLNDILSSLPSEPPGTLTTGDLAKRLRVDGSTLSHKKKDKSLQELTEWTRKKDPEGIGWTFLAEFNRYKPERVFSSEPPMVLQSDLLSSGVADFPSGVDSEKLHSADDYPEF